MTITNDLGPNEKPLKEEREDRGEECFIIMN